ncbi:MAG: DUF2391 family protein [Candidatus Nanohaloarchaea archaeon]
MLKSVLKKLSPGYSFGKDDFFQQVLGGALLTAPFLFTEEVWRIAANVSLLQSLASVTVSFALGHGVLYIAETERDWEEERKILGLTWRYVSLMAVSFGSILLLMLLTSPQETFGASNAVAARVVALTSIFAVIGAATADNLV